MMTSSVDGTKDDGAEQKKYTKAEKKAARLVQRNFKKFKARKLMYAMVQGKFSENLIKSIKEGYINHRQFHVVTLFIFVYYYPHILNKHFYIVNTNHFY